MSTRQWRVMIVEDDFRVAAIHADIVAEAPAFTVQASVRTVAEARALIDRDPPDLLLADVYLPDGDGLTFVGAIGVDAFILSAADEPATIRRAFQAGAMAYLLKPFPKAELLDRLDRYARHRHLVSGQRGLSQAKIDRAFAILHGPGERMPVARSATEELLLDVLGDGELSAAQAAEKAGVSRATAQRRLADLAGQGVVNVRLRYGSSGRPEHRYSRV